MAAGDPEVKTVVGDLEEAAAGVPAVAVEAGARTSAVVRAGAAEVEEAVGAPAEVTNGRPINVLTYLATTQFIEVKNTLVCKSWRTVEEIRCASSQKIRLLK